MYYFPYDWYFYKKSESVNVAVLSRFHSVSDFEMV